MIMKLKIVVVLSALIIFLSTLSTPALAYSPFTLNAPVNLTAELLYDDNGIPFFILKLDIPSEVREVNENLLMDPEFYSEIYCEGIEIVFDIKYGKYDWNEGPSPYWNTSDDLSAFIDRGEYWEYRPFSEDSADYSNVKSENYCFRARFYALWGKPGDWIDNELYSEYSYVATTNLTEEPDLIVPTKSPTKPIVSINPTPTPTVNATSTNASYDIFAEVQGIRGESTANLHKNQIDVLSLSYEGQISNASSTASSGNVQLNNLRMVKAVDKASPKLLDAMAKGIHMKDIKIYFEKVNISSNPALKITLQDVLISSYRIRIDNDGKLIEEIGISYMKADFEYNQLAQNGTIITTTTKAIDLQTGYKVTASKDNVFSTESATLASEKNKTYDIFAKFDGIRGEVANNEHKNQIDVISLNFGGQNNAKPGSATSDKTQFNTIKMVKFFDLASPTLIESMASGRHIKDVTFFYEKIKIPNNPILKLTLKDILIKSYKLSTDRTGKLIEEIGISYTKADYEYAQLAQDGTIIYTSNTTIDLHSGFNAFNQSDAAVAYEDSEAQLTTQSGGYDIFARFDGITGESNDSQHKNEVDILSLSFGGHNNAMPGLTSAGKTLFNNVKFTKPLDKSSPTLLDTMAKGRYIKEVKFSLEKANNSNLVIKLTLKAIKITSYNLYINNEGKFIEEFGLSFDKAEYEYTQATQNGMVNNPVKATVDLYMK